MSEGYPPLIGRFGRLMATGRRTQQAEGFIPHVEASDTSGQVISSGSVLQFSTVAVDRTKSWDGTTFRAPRSGVYLIAAGHYKAATVTSTLEAWINDVLATRLSESNAGVGTQEVNGARSHFLQQNDKLQIKYAGAGYTSTAVSGINWISITWVGP